MLMPRLEIIFFGAPLKISNQWPTPPTAGSQRRIIIEGSVIDQQRMMMIGQPTRHVDHPLVVDLLALVVGVVSNDSSRRRPLPRHHQRRLSLDEVVVE